MSPLAEPRLYFNRQMTDVELLPVAGGCLAVFSDRCPDKPTANEDAAGVFPFGEEAAVIAVADGLGGTPGGEHAARRAIEALHQALANVSPHDGALRTAVLNGFEAANQAVTALGYGAGTTLTVVEIQRNTIRPYHVGDTDLLVVGQRGKIRMQTVSHSPVGVAVHAGWLQEDEALHHVERHIVLNVIGASDMRIEVGSPLVLNPRDTLLVASDGLFDNLRLDEIIARQRKGPLADAVRRLAADGQARMHQPASGQPSKPDDLTILAFRLGNCPSAATKRRARSPGKNNRP